MDAIKYDSIYSKYSQKQINEIETFFEEIDTAMLDEKFFINKKMDMFFNKFLYIEKDFMLMRCPERAAKNFKIIEEKFPIKNEIWDSYRLEHNVKGLCAYFIYKIEKDKIVYKKVDVLY